MMKKSIERKIREALTGVSQGEEVRVLGAPLLSRLTEPPSYLVHILLSVVLGLGWTKEDKSAWAVHVAFRGFQFLLSDWKASSWSIYSPTSGPTVTKAAEALQRKLVFGGRLLNQALQPELEQHVKSGNFFLLNSYRHVRPAYEYFREALERELKGLKDLRSTIPAMEPDPARDKTVTVDGFTKGGIKITPLSGFSEHMTKILRAQQAVSHYSAAMAGFFYSYTELLFDITFALSDPRPMTYHQFRALTWADRFKTAFPVSKDKSLAAIYERLAKIKQRVRDVVFHGFGGEPALLVPLSHLGLIPVSYEVAQSSVHYSWVPVSETEAEEMLQSFVEFDAWIDDSDSQWYARRYAESLFEVPFESGRVAEVRGWMTSRTAFEKAVENESERRDYLSEQY